MDCSAFNDAVAFIRNARLPPTHVHLAVAKVWLDQGRSASIDELIDCALDARLGLSRETLAATLGRFAERGLIGAP